jgi:hypothetical protein
MPFVEEFYDAETLQLMTRALKEALREAGGMAGIRDGASDFASGIVGLWPFSDIPTCPLDRSG